MCVYVCVCVFVCACVWVSLSGCQLIGLASFIWRDVYWRMVSALREVIINSVPHKCQCPPAIRNMADTWLQPIGWTEDQMSVFVVSSMWAGRILLLLVLLSICLFVNLSVCVSVCLPIYLSICLSVYLGLSICLSICRYLLVFCSTCPSVCLFLSVCLFILARVCIYNYICSYNNNVT